MQTARRVSGTKTYSSPACGADPRLAAHKKVAHAAVMTTPNRLFLAAIATHLSTLSQSTISPYNITVRARPRSGYKVRVANPGPEANTAAAGRGIPAAAAGRSSNAAQRFSDSVTTASLPASTVTGFSAFA